jgi:hypothetical protein
MSPNDKGRGKHFSCITNGEGGVHVGGPLEAVLCRRWGERRSWRRCTSAPYRRSLYGITVDRLGKEATTSARNTRLVEICRHARDSAGGRVVETLATGMPKILQSVSDVGFPPPLFQDTGIRFTAVLRRAVPVPKALTGSARAVHAALVQGG